MRGILYIVWGDKCEPQLQRSMLSVRRHHPDIPIQIARPPVPQNPHAGLLLKSKMGSLTPFDTTLYLDADTVVMGNLDYGFERAEKFGVACCICECPWTRRYGQDRGDELEYNTGVVFFSKLAKDVFSTWESIAETTPSEAIWSLESDKHRGPARDDQSSFSRALHRCGMNPVILPPNYNLRPQFCPIFFTPVKVWHDYKDPPPGLEDHSISVEAGKTPVTYIELLGRGDK